METKSLHPQTKTNKTKVQCMSWETVFPLVNPVGYLECSLLWVGKQEIGFVENILSYASLLWQAAPSAPLEGSEVFGLCHAGDAFFVRSLIHFLSSKIFFLTFKS